MKPEQVTYEKFSQITQKMVDNGEKLTVRNVHGRLGGSFGKISEFLKRWEQERAYLNLVKQGDISDSLRQSMLSEIGKAVGDAKAALETQLQQMTSHLEEANEKLKEQEQLIDDSSEQLIELKEKLVQSNQIIKDDEVSNHDLKQKLESSIQEKILAITDAAKSKLQLERADDDLRDMKVQIKDLQKRVDLLTQEKYEAEKNAAVAEARFDQLIKKDPTKP